MTTVASLFEQILAAQGLNPEDLERNPNLDSGTKRVDAVPDTPELRRIVELPRRELDAVGEALVESMTMAFRRPGGSMFFKPVQAAALHDIHQFGGLFGPIRVGGGKTLISYMAPVVADAVRPLLLIPAKLREKTRREFGKLSAHWHGPPFYRVMSYEWLGRPQAADALLDLQPDFIVMDECHKVKNTRAAVTKRVKRYLESLVCGVCGFNPPPPYGRNQRCSRCESLLQPRGHVPVVALSGTITKRSLRDYAHIIKWCLPHTNPTPQTFKDLEHWADALDESVGAFRRVRPGALIKLCTPEESRRVQLGGEEGLNAVRRAYRRRMVETPGVVATKETPLDMTLAITAAEPRKRDSAIDAAFEVLRTEWETPDGHPLADGFAVWRHARELGLGFFYRWNPRPPDEWMDKRKAWARFCRHVLRYNRSGIDSEAQVAAACARGSLPAQEYNEWAAIRPTFEPNSEAVWLSTEALDFAAGWLKRSKGIAWVDMVEFGVELSRMTGLPYYGRQGLDAQGNFIEDHAPGKPLIASIASNSEGRNLQHGWAANLITCPMPNGVAWEQLLGRTHRDGQQADEVSADVYLGCIEHAAGFHQACSDAVYMENTGGGPQKLTRADIDVPDMDMLNARGGFRWNK